MKDGCASSALSLENLPAADLLNPIIDMIADAVVERLQRAAAPRLLNTREAAQYLHRSERWVRQEVALGKLPCVREGNSRPRFERESLDRWIAGHNGRA